MQDAGNSERATTESKWEWKQVDRSKSIADERFITRARTEDCVLRTPSGRTWETAKAVETYCLWIASKLADGKKVSLPNVGELRAAVSAKGRTVVYLRPDPYLAKIIDALDQNSPNFFKESVT